MKLYSYWRSTTSVRVRIALNMKRVDHQIETVDLVKGEQSSSDYEAVNPSKGVPSLVLDDGTTLTQSMAILQYLDSVYPEPPLFPEDPVERSKVEAAAHCIALDIHPVNNLKVLNYLKSNIGSTQEKNVEYMCHWMHEGFSAFQTLIRDDTPFCFGDAPNIADLCLVGQMINARRWGLDLTPFARLVDIDERCRAIPAFDQAMPENQPDAQPL